MGSSSSKSEDGKEGKMINVEGERESGQDAEPTPGCLKSLVKTMAERMKEWLTDPRNKKRIKRAQLLAVGASWAVDVLTDMNVVVGLIFNTGKKPPQYRIATVVTGSIIIPSVAVWAFLFSYGMVGWPDLALGVLQVGIVKEFIMSWTTGTKSAGFFWYTATEGNMESPANSVLTMYVLLLGITNSGHFFFFFSVLWSVMSTARAGTDLDLYGQTSSVATYISCLSIRFCTGAVRSMGLGFFAYLTRPHVSLTENAAFLIWIILIMDFGMMMSIINLGAKKYPRLVKLFFACLLVFASPPQCLRSFDNMKDSHRLIHAFEFFLMSAVALYMSQPWDRGPVHEFVTGQKQPLVCLFFVASIIVWTMMAISAFFRVINVQTLADARIKAQEQDRNTCHALQQAAVRDVDPVLTGLLLVEMEDSLQHFLRQPDGTFRPVERSEKGGVTIVEMVLKAGIFSFPEDEPPNTERLKGMTVVMKAVTTHCDIELLSKKLDEDDELAARRESKRESKRKSEIGELGDEEEMQEWPLDVLIWHHLRLSSGKFTRSADPDACAGKAARCLEMAGAVVDRLEVEETARQGSTDAELLWEVVFRRQEKCLEYMLRAKASLLIFDEVGRTPLHEAATSCWKAGMELFSKLGYDFDKALALEDSHKMTPLHCLELTHKFAEQDNLLSDKLLCPDTASYEDMKTMLSAQEEEKADVETKGYFGGLSLGGIHKLGRRGDAPTKPSGIDEEI